jgi:methyl-accepting chemotaxis protein
MLNKLSINTRILSLIAIPAIVLSTIGYFSYIALNENEVTSHTIQDNTEIFTDAYKATLAINKNYTRLLTNINSNFIFWSAANKRTKKAIKRIESTQNSFNAKLNDHWTQEQANSPELLQIQGSYERLLKSYKALQPLFTKKETEENKKALDKYVIKKMYPLSNSLISQLSTFTESTRLASNTMAEKNAHHLKEQAKLLTGFILASILFTLIFGLLIMRSITKPTKKLTQVVQRLSEGEFDARVKVTGSDEFSHLGVAFNDLLDDRETTLKSVDTEHKELNQSIFQLLQAVAELSERNLTIRATVTEDATGPVADAINLLAEETSATLSQVKNIALEVNTASQRVNTHLMSVNKLAMQEQEQAIETAEQMDKMLQRLDGIANTAAETNTMADNTSLSTQKAHESVTQTLSGMSDIRETVQETGKRIKQLGERSQEISHVIEIINTIAERTTVLALNASMQATAAGDAGKGFSVIAEEIQRLAESSRESTGQISTLVRNIQQETNTTIATMDQTIEQVVSGSVKAEDAATQMKEVLETTSQLVEAVNHIAETSREQVGITEVLKHKAESILKSTQSTGQELLSLTGLSRNMSEYAQRLVQSVGVFTLDTKPTENSKQSAKV